MQKLERYCSNLLYEAIALDTPLYDTSISTEKTKERERLLLRTLVAPGSSIRLLVKSLSMNVPDETSQSLGSYHLSALIRLCPNLINLWSPNVSTTFYKKIKALYSDGHLQQLKCITMPLFDSMNFLVMESYNDVILDFKETIIELVIANMVDEFLDFRSNFPLSQDLQDFTRLETLHIIANSNVFLYELDILFKNCGPLLNTVRIEINNNEGSGLFYEKKEDVLANIHPIYQIKDLEITNHQSLSVNELGYVMLKFPHLEKLEIKDYQEDRKYYSFISSPEGILCNFFEYLSTIHEVDIVDLIAGAEATSVSLPFLAKSKQVKKMIITTASPGYDDIASINLKHKKEADGCELFFQFRFENAEYICKETLDSFKSTVENLVLCSDNEYEYEYDDEEEKEDEKGIEMQTKPLGESLDFILDQYASLQNLKLQLINIPVLPLKPISTRTLNTLDIQSCSSIKDALTQISQRVSHVNNFLHSRGVWMMSIGKNHFEDDICMPYTTFNTIRLYFNHDSYIIKIYTNFSIRLFKYPSQER